MTENGIDFKELKAHVKDFLVLGADVKVEMLISVSNDQPYKAELKSTASGKDVFEVSVRGKDLKDTAEKAKELANKMKEEIKD